MERYDTLNSNKDYIVLSGYSLSDPGRNNSFLFASLNMKELCVINTNRLIDIKNVRTGEIFKAKTINDKFELSPEKADNSTFSRRSNICWEFFQALDVFSTATNDLYSLNDENSEIFKLYLANDSKQTKADFINEKAMELRKEKNDSISYMHWLVKALDNITKDFSFCSSTREYVYGKIMNQINYHANNILHPRKYSLNTSVSQLNDLICELNVKVFVPEKTANRLIDNFEVEERENFVEPQKTLEDFFPSISSAPKI